MAIGFGIVGCGMIARFHARAIGDIRGAKLVGCYSSRMESAETFANEFECQPYAQLSELLKNEQLDAISICSPSGAHMEPALAAAKAGKHVIVEKPLEINVRRCDRIIDACEKHGVKLATIFPSRFHKA
ncbi:MAG: Gfo/Idh/MocA family oxidoreductase, partial [Planctomycetota bacterium]